MIEVVAMFNLSMIRLLLMLLGLLLGLLVGVAGTVDKGVVRRSESSFVSRSDAKVAQPAVIAVILQLLMLASFEVATLLLLLLRWIGGVLRVLLVVVRGLRWSQIGRRRK